MGSRLTYKAVMDARKSAEARSGNVREGVKLGLEMKKERDALTECQKREAGLREAAREDVAKLLWERFAPDHEVDWPSIHAGEYRSIADELLATLIKGSA